MRLLVYTQTMSRTQVYLGDEELGLLDERAAQTGATRSELIRRAIRQTYGKSTMDEALQGLRASAGSWQAREFTGREYVEEVRTDLNKRLEEQGVD